jgi:ribosomal RNA assembly protein
MDLMPVSKKTIDKLKLNDNALLKQIEKKGEVKIKINEFSQLEIEGEGGNDWIVTQVLHAIDYGFLPVQAFKLFKDTFFLEIIDLEIILKNEKAMERMKGRVIGAEGRAKKTIQEITGAYLAISGNKIAILGEFDDIKLAKEGVTRLLEGAAHISVYGYLERKNRERKYNL